MSADNIVASGAWGAVEWAKDARGRLPAKEFYDALDDEDKAKLLALFKRMATTGKILNQEKFKKLTNIRKQALYEFKSFQLRMIGGFAPGFRFLLAHGVRKKKDEHNRTDLEVAARVLEEHVEGGEGK